MDCNDFILDNIVGIDICLASSCAITLPPAVALQSLTTTEKMFGTPVLSIRMDGTGDVEMVDQPTIKATNSRAVSGQIFTHDVQIPIYIGHEKAQKAVSDLQGNLFHLIYIKADGSRALGYSLPNTSQCDIDLSPNINAASTLKLKIQSMSAFIRLD